MCDIVDGQKSVEFLVNFGDLLGSCSNTTRGDNEAYERANGPMIIATIPTVFLPGLNGMHQKMLV